MPLLSSRRLSLGGCLSLRSPANCLGGQSACCILLLQRHKTARRSQSLFRLPSLIPPSSKSLVLLSSPKSLLPTLAHQQGAPGHTPGCTILVLLILRCPITQQSKRYQALGISKFHARLPPPDRQLAFTSIPCR